MATITSEGVTPTSLAAYRTILENRYRQAFGDDLSLDAETPVGQIIGIEALANAEIDEIVVNYVNGFSTSHAVGRQLDDLVSLLRIARQGATNSTLTLRLSGVAGTTVHAGSRARSSEGTEWATDADATIASSGTIDAAATAVSEGAITAAVNTITTIVTLIAGWETVTNTTAAIPGRDSESDLSLRTRYRSSTSRLANGPIDAIRAALIDAGVTRLRVVPNDTGADSTVQSVTINAHTILCIVQSGTDADIADAIERSKGLGTGTSGTTTVGDIRFTRASTVPIAVAVTTVGNERFPADGLLQIKQSLVDYSLGLWTGQTGQFDTDGFLIGQPIIVNRLYSPVNSVPGHTTSILTATRQSDGSALPGLPQLHQLYTLALDDITVNIT